MALQMTKGEVETFLNENKEMVMQVLHEQNRKPITHAKLTERYTDIKGNKYYGFPQDMALPVERLGELNRFMQYISKGLTAEEDDEFDDRLAKVALSDIKETDKKIQMGAIWTEKKKRKKLCIHTELFYNYLAVQWVRHDENPEYYDTDIQHEKVSQFKEEVKIGGSYFFFQVPEFKKLNDLLRLSESEWNALWRESLIQQSMLSEILKVYSSANTSKSKEKILTNN